MRRDIIICSVTPFLGIPQPDPAEAKAAIIPAPLEATVSYGRGAATGPAAIMAASSQVELYDEFLDATPSEHGILTRGAVSMRGSMEDILARIEAGVGLELEAGRLPVLVGGEHTVTLGAVRALKSRRGGDFTVLSLDAHLDLRQEYLGDCLSHACVMRRVLDLGLEVRHLGVRSCSKEEMDLVRERGLSPVWSRDVHCNSDWVEKSLKGITGPVYISLDIDGLDPGIMPATGTPEPGGLDWFQVSDWLKAVCGRHEVVGLDLVELSPINGQPAWDFTAARLLHRAIGLCLMERK